MKNKIGFAILAAVLVLITVFAASAQTFNITSTPALSAVVGQQYSYQMTANTTGIKFETVSGPEGLSVTTTGLFMWTPTTAGTFAFNLSATRNASSVQYQTFNVVVSQATSSNMLEIDEIRVNVNGAKEDTLSGPGTIDYDAELDDEITLLVTVKNNFNVRNDSTIIRSISMDVLSNDLDDADGLDESISKLEAGKDDDMSVTFTLDPSNVDPSDAPFDITIDVEGRTSDGKIYTDSWIIRLDMQTNSKDLYMYNLEASPLSFSSCNENKVKISADLRNIGTRDLDNAAIRLKISDLGINKFVSEINIDSGDEDSFSDYVTIPKGVTPGVYLLEIDALPVRTTNTVTFESAFDITVLKCDAPVVNDNTDTDNQGTDIDTGNNNGGTVIIPDVAVTGTPVSTAVGKKGLFDSTSSLYLVLLGALIVLLLVIIVLLIIRLRE